MAQMRRSVLIACILAIVIIVTVDAGNQCPLCNMDVEAHGKNKWYLEFKYGQRIYTCNMLMTDTGASVSHATRLAKKLSDVVVEDSQCSGDTQFLSANLTRDPVNGEIVRDADFYFVCFRNGQRLFFSSVETKNTIKDSFKTQPCPYTVKSQCGDSPCRDFTDAVSGNALSVGGSDRDVPFCKGATAMFNGFTTVGTGETCVLMLFQPWVLDSAVKYFFGIIGAFLMAVTNELLVRGRGIAKQRIAGMVMQRETTLLLLSGRVVLAILYTAQVTLAYFLMLLVMTYEVGMFCMLIFGFGVGFVLFRDLDESEVDSKANQSYVVPPRVVAMDKTMPSTVLNIEGMHCSKTCETAVQKALEAVPGVCYVCMLFDEGKAIVIGAAGTEALTDAVERAGFNAHISSTSRMIAV